MRYWALRHAGQGRSSGGERISGVATKTENIRTIVGSRPTSKGNAVDLALSQRGHRGNETIRTMRSNGRASSERTRVFQWSISRLAQPEPSNPPKLKT